MRIVPVKIIWATKIATRNATFVHAQLLVAQRENTAVAMEGVRPLVINGHARMQNANATQGGLEENVKYQVALGKIFLSSHSLYYLAC